MRRLELKDAEEATLKQHALPAPRPFQEFHLDFPPRVKVVAVEALTSYLAPCAGVDPLS
jgi:hypothetical protein